MGKNTSAESKTRVKERLAELESLLTETGSATVSKPGNELMLPDATIKSDTTIKKVEASFFRRAEKWARNISSPASAFRCVFGLTNRGESWKASTARNYETVGYVISGSARLDLEGQTLNLKAGDLWLVPAGAMHQYTIINPFTAVEATAPPAEVHGRDTPA